MFSDNIVVYMFSISYYYFVVHIDSDHNNVNVEGKEEDEGKAGDEGGGIPSLRLSQVLSAPLINIL